MFGTIAAAGIRILATLYLDRRTMLIMAVSFGLGLGVAMVPNLLQEMPKMIQNIFGSAVTMAGLSAILLNTLLPRTDTRDVEDNSVSESLASELK
jgi:xanthine permease XanP